MASAFSQTHRTTQGAKPVKGKGHKPFFYPDSEELSSRLLR